MSNDHVLEYLTYYCALPHPPHYAVMVSGPWGVGKTYLVKRFLNRHFEESKRPIYVSLYGLSTIDEIDAALFQAIYPALGWKTTKVGVRVGKTLLKKFGLDPDIKAADLISKFDANTYVFDDLERCEASKNIVLGYINEFVEHDGCKVIVIANEAEISEPEYRKRREKLIGKTLEVESAFDDAFAYFISMIDDPSAKLICERNAANIRSVYSQSGLNNLRILQQTMWDFERFCRALTQKQRENADAMEAFLRLLFALSFEIKSGRIGSDDLRSRVGRVASALIKDEKENASQFAAARHRYPDIDLADSMLPDALLSGLLVKGIVDEKELQTSMDRSRYFVNVANEPAWRTVWHWYERTDAEITKAYLEMERQFAAREILNGGELAHVMGLRLFLADRGVLGKTRALIVEECERYIDDQLAAGRLGDPSQLTELRFSGYGGLGIQQSDTHEYKRLFIYLTGKAQHALERTYPEKAAALLAEMKENPRLFFTRICATNSDENLYYRTPILPFIDPDKFVDTVLDQHPADQRTILMAFKGRYESGELNGDLASEKDWLISVRTKFGERADSLPPVGKYRLLETVRSNFPQKLDDADAG
jgi:KAP family P-loop domain